MTAGSEVLKRWQRLSEAVSFALVVHADQTRKGTTVPYISHLLSVAGLVLEYGGDEEQAMAGLLHDAIEDQGAHLEADIRARFGDRVAGIVRACTDADTVPKPPWRARKEAYISHLGAVGADALLVSCADKLHNVRSICTDLRSIGLAVYDRFAGGLSGTLWYYRALADAFVAYLPGPISSELVEAVREMGRLTRLLEDEASSGPAQAASAKAIAAVPALGTMGDHRR